MAGGVLTVDDNRLFPETDFADSIADTAAVGFVPKPEVSADAIRRIVDGQVQGPPGARVR